MGQSSSSSSGGIGLFGLLTVIFVTAKIFGWQPVAAWSWWWVFSPLWGVILVTVVVMSLVVGGGLALDWYESRKARKRRELARR